MNPMFSFYSLNSPITKYPNIGITLAVCLGVGVIIAAAAIAMLLTRYRNNILPRDIDYRTSTHSKRQHRQHSKLTCYVMSYFTEIGEMVERFRLQTLHQNWLFCWQMNFSATYQYEVWVLAVLSAGVVSTRDSPLKITGPEANAISPSQLKYTCAFYGVGTARAAGGFVGFLDSRALFMRMGHPV